MDVFLLGAGRPATGDKPSALKNIAHNTKAMDWQIHSFESIAGLNDIHYLGGYHVDEVIENYPKLNFTVVPDWEIRSVLHTLLKAPFTGHSIIASYSDTVFRKEVVSDMLLIDADVVFCVDSHWKERYELRSANDIQSAETIEIDSSTGELNVVEFTGLIYFKNDAVKHLSDLDEIDVGSNLIDLISYLQGTSLSVKPFDVAGHWAELNSPNDIARFILGTKSETLSRLEPMVRQSHIGKQVSFKSTRWINNSDLILDEISTCFSETNLIVRSSSKGEDNWHSSNAGGFESLLHVNSDDRLAVRKSIEIVLASYGEKHHDGEDQVLVQECLQNVRASGVVFTCSLETGAPYYRFNFDDKTQSTESVTSGIHGDLRTIVVSRFAPEYLEQIEPKIVPVLHAVQELEQLLGFDKLDIEFAIDENGQVHVFQVRPITVDHSEYEVDITSIDKSLKGCALRFQTQQNPTPFVYGDKTIFANMPDWNPAEIIGTRPKPLAFSLYRHLITNDVWAQQRFEFGYRDVRPYPLILSFSGQPYVDARASLNSFIPRELPNEVAERLATAYISILADNPHYHDKIEFDVAFTVWTPDFYNNASNRLIPYGVSADDIAQLEVTLKNITCNALTRLSDDIAPINQLSQRRASIENSDIPVVDKIFALLDDCRRFGTLAFSHAARAGFVATILLKSIVKTGILTDERRSEFLRSIKTVAGEFEDNKYAYKLGRLSLEDLIVDYGHLRPGTYDICAQAYWEDPKRYFLTSNMEMPKLKSQFTFLLSESENIKIMLDDLGAKQTPDELLKYLQEAIEARESVKFEFTRNLSRALDKCTELAEELQLTREEMSFLEYHDLEQLKLNVTETSKLKEKANQNMKTYVVSQTIELPGFIKQVSDFYCFERHSLQPNFVSINRIHAAVKLLSDSKPEDLTGAVVLIPQADPGFDWLFGYNIGGLITQFGGANSHMAIRAAEIGLPAAIGVGEKLYEQITRMRQIELDCSNQIIREIQ